jgi:hypothetical protein
MPPRLLVFCSALLGALTARASWAQQAAPPESGPTHRRHLLQATVRGGGAWLGGDVDAQYGRSGAYGGLGVGYSLATRGVDFGAGFDFLAVPDRDHPRRVYVPTLALRFHLPISESVEFGLGLRAGWSWVTLADVRDDSGARKDHTFSGVHLGLVPHLRVWMSPRVAADVGAELLVAGGGDTVGNQVRATYLERSARVGALGAFLRVSFGL